MSDRNRIHTSSRSDPFKNNLQKSGQSLSPLQAWLIYEKMSQDWLRMNNRRLEEAIQEYDRALSLLPDFACTLFRKGAIYGVQKRHEEALKELMKLISSKLSTECRRPF
jgi:tetratricopeptide (TPR) repeat protein